MRPELFRNLAMLGPVLFAAGCQGGPSINAGNAEAFTYSFVQGKVQLASDNPLTLPSPWYRRRVFGLWMAGRWADLAADVAENAYDMDLNWFYLGESAKGQGFIDAARVYYRRAYTDSVSWNANRRCSSFLHIDYTFCAGLSFPRDLVSRVP